MRHLWSAVFVLVAWAGCGSGDDGATGGGQRGDACRANAECPSALVCIGPSERVACGVPPREGCNSSTDCATGTVCHAIADSCSDDGVGSECKPPCNSDNCGPDFICGADGACRAKRCDAGVSCKVYEACDPAAISPGAPVHAQSAGCRRVVCANDAACPATTACVNGLCHAGKGACGELVVVP